MEKQPLTPKMLRQRQLLLALPIIILPFLTLFFWALGGGKPDPANAEVITQKGLDMSLPDAKLKDRSTLNKMGYYDQAMLDSVKLKEQIKSDPYYRQRADTDTLHHHLPLVKNGIKPDSLSFFQKPLNPANDRKASEAQVYHKLAELQQTINQSATVPVKKQTPSGTDPDIEAMQKRFQIPQSQSADDPEMAQMDNLLEKVLDIQHPDRVNEKLKENSEKHLGQVFNVSPNTKGTPVTAFGGGSSTSDFADTTPYRYQTNGFYSLGDVAVNENNNAIAAVIAETQTVVNGSVVKLRLVHDVMINGVLIPKDSFLSGMASLNGERLAIKINGIRFQNSLFPVALSVYDLDGLEGIEIPGAISRDVAKESAASSMQNLGMTSFAPSFGAQAAGAGIDAAKTLFTRKVKLIKVTVKAGYQVLLKDEKVKNN
jgi:conjugative transposon TraM protein